MNLHLCRKIYSNQHFIDILIESRNPYHGNIRNSNSWEGHKITSNDMIARIQNPIWKGFYVYQLIRSYPNGDDNDNYDVCMREWGATF